VHGFSVGSSPDSTACRRAGGIIKVWLNPRPSPYGPYVFQASCNDELFLTYTDATSAYESRRAFSQILAWGLFTLSAGALGFLAVRQRERSRRGIGLK
jgi:hypothetical protein